VNSQRNAGELNQAGDRLPPTAPKAVAPSNARAAFRIQGIRLAVEHIGWHQQD